VLSKGDWYQSPAGTDTDKSTTPKDGEIHVMERETGKILIEKIPTSIKVSLKIMYTNPGGRFAVGGDQIKKLLKHLTTKQGVTYTDPASKKEIKPFIEYHNLNTAEMLDDVSSFKNFNEFFYRKLKPNARPVDLPDDSSVAVSPADCRLNAYQTMDDATRFWIKGKGFTLKTLLDDDALATKFTNCSIVISRLAPQDYHRYHIPVDGVLGNFKHIDTGVYYTVNPIAINQQINVYGENKRCIVPIETKEFGTVIYVAVGATLVGSINMTRKPGDTVKRGEELGYFAFGGSTVLVLFQAGTIEFYADLVTNSNMQRETLVSVGSKIGISTKK